MKNGERTIIIGRNLERERESVCVLCLGMQIIIGLKVN